MEKKLEFAQLTQKSAANPNTGLCGRKTSNLCLILFFNGEPNVTPFIPLLDSMKNDPISFAYIKSSDEAYVAK